jgi:chromosome segregation ATPase
MFSNVIEDYLRSMKPEMVTDVFILLMFLSFLLAVIWSKKDVNHAFVNYAPSLLTSLGILGTFLGIVLGLLEFNTTNVEGSIVKLLDGLKVAFITSVIGILGSILIKFLINANIITPKITENSKIQDLDISDLYNIMNMQNENLIKLQNVLSDNQESSIIGQMKLMRSDITDNNKKNNEQILILSQHLNTIVELGNYQKESFNGFQFNLWNKLQDFADMLSKSATEQVIEALNSVIKDFNEKLTEQFGENFKQLNNAVIKLVDWQENYKNQLEQMKNQFDLSVDSMSGMEKSIEQISTHSKSIPESMSNLEVVINTNQNQVEELNRHLEVFKDMRDKAVEAVPAIKEQVEKTLEGFSNASNEIMTSISSSTDKISVTLVQNAENFADNVSKTNGALVDSSDTLKSSSSQIREQLDATILDLNKHVRIMIEDLSNNSKEISTNFKAVGESLEEELTKTNKKFNSMLDESTNKLQVSIENLSNEQLKQTKKVLDGLDSTIKDILTDTGASVSNQVKLMDEIAAKEIENVMNAMGTALARISNQFTNDYQKLVTEMKKIIEANK